MHITAAELEARLAAARKESEEAKAQIEDLKLKLVICENRILDLEGALADARG